MRWTIAGMHFRQWLTIPRAAVTISLLVGCPVDAQTGPTIYSGGVVNPADNVDAYSVGGLARGSLFSIYGNNLAPSAATASGLPLPTLLNGVQVKVYAGTTTLQEFDAPLLYVSPFLINAILPSTAPEGEWSVIVVANGIQSNAVLITVTTSRFAAFARSQLGFGPAVLQQFDRTGVFLNGLMHPAAPGQTVMLWGTGLGPLPSGSDAAAPGLVNLGGNVVLSVGGVAVKPDYAGRAPTIPGVDVIKFNLPSSLPAGCYIPMTVYVGGQPADGVFQSQDNLGVTAARPPRPPLTLSVGVRNTPCASGFGLTSAQLRRLDQGGTVRVAALVFDSETYGQGSQSAGQFSQYTRAWMSDYDVAHLSLLATGWQLNPSALFGFCDRQNESRPASPPFPDTPSSMIVQHTYGALSNAATLVLKIAGSSGCSAWGGAWVTSSGITATNADNCPASSYSLSGSARGVTLFSVSGSLPAPRKSSAADQLLVNSQNGGGPGATWNVADLKPDDQLTLMLSSSKTISTGGLFPSGYFYYDTNWLICPVSTASNSFPVQFGDAQWAWQFGQEPSVIHAARFSLSALSGKSAGIPATPLPGAPEVFVLLIRDQLSVQTPPLLTF